MVGEKSEESYYSERGKATYMGKGSSNPKRTQGKQWATQHCQQN